MPLLSYFFPTVKADEAEEEEELVDPQVVLKEQCIETSKCTALKEKLENCNNRVLSKSQTTETCTEEMFDFLHCVDHCVAKDLWSKLNRFKKRVNSDSSGWVTYEMKKIKQLRSYHECHAPLPVKFLFA